MRKHLITLLLIGLACTGVRAQVFEPMLKGTGVPYYQGIPQHTPTARGPEIAWVRDSTTFYYYDLASEEWKKLRTGSGTTGAATQAVTSNATLRGDGTADDPLRVDTTIIATRAHVRTEILANGLQQSIVNPVGGESSVSIGYQINTARPDFVYRNGQLLEKDLTYTRAGTTYFFTTPLKNEETIRIVNYAQ